jgi:hypothetical protein
MRTRQNTKRHNLKAIKILFVCDFLQVNNGKQREGGVGFDGNSRAHPSITAETPKAQQEI